MFHSVYKNLFHLSSCRNAKPTFPCIYLSFSLRSISATLQSASTSQHSDTTNLPSFTFSYLTNSCGLSPEEATTASKKIELKTNKNSKSVLILLKNQGFSPTQIRKAIIKNPDLLLAKPEKTLKPKLDFFRSLGLSSSELATIFSVNPVLFKKSLEKKIIPSIDFLKKIICDRENFFYALKFSCRLIEEKDYYPNIETLKKHGVPSSSITKLFATRPGALRRSPERFSEIVEEVKKMGLNPSSLMFIHAVGVMSFMSKSTWERKLALYKSFGWSDAEILMAFVKQPTCMGMSDGNIKQKMDFFENKLGWTPALLSMYPLLLLYSLEKRIVPRCSVLSVLMSKGIIKRNAGIPSILAMAESKFVENYVTRYKVEIPEVAKAFEGMIGILDWEMNYGERHVIQKL